MGYLSCRAESSISTCRSISAVAPSQKKSPTNEEKEDKNVKAFVSKHIEQFQYAEIESATNNFSDSSLLGRGSHGSVYKATVHIKNSPLVVAVKRSSPRQVLSPLSRNEVENEIQILSDISSPRIVNLIGYTSISSSKLHRLLVIEYMPNGTLYDSLHNNPRLINWSRRLRFALQTAKALVTLHSLVPPVIHRDVKSANVLIDCNFNARLGDFGLALRLDDDDSDGKPALPYASSCRSTPPAGTLGYLDPCYVTPDNLSTKTDVFSFGILLLEIMSGRKAIDVAHSPPSVVEWAVPLLRKGKVGSIYDPRIPPPKGSRVRRRLALLAVSCVRASDERRPSMEEVVEQLKVLSKALSSAGKAWNGLTVGNPCSMVEIGGIPLKSNPNKEMIDDAANKKPQLSVVSANNSVKVVKPLRKGNESRNLMDFLAQPERVRSSVIGRSRTMRIGGEYSGRRKLGRLQRNQTLK